MKRWTLMLTLLLAIAGGITWPIPARAQTAEEIAKMEEAMPGAGRMTPAEPRKLLVFNLCKGYAHSAIPYGAKAFEIMGKKTGAFEATLTDDPAVFATDSLNQYDAVVMNNTTGEIFEDPALKQSLLDFVKGGKGIIGVHAATDCFYQWAEYGEMMGGYFDGHPWGSGDTVTVEIDDPGHPLCAVFQGKRFDVKDEIYQIKAPYSRENLRVLLSLYTGTGTATNLDKGTAIKRTDGDFAVSWIRQYGEGRVFYCSLGHNHEIFWTPALLQYYLDGIQFALGDLEADMTPSAKLPADYAENAWKQAQVARVDEILKEIVTYEFGDSRERFTELNDIIIESYGMDDFRAQVAQKLAGLLSSDATLAFKQYACRQLFVIGTAEQVPAIAPLLLDADTSDMARYALERMPGPEVCEALVNALGKADGMIKVGIINTLGERGNKKVIPEFAALAAGPDPAVAAAALAALGKIGGPEAAKALAQAKDKVPADLFPAAADAYLLCGDGLLSGGDVAGAVAIYDEMFKVSEPERVKLAAFEGLVKARGADAVPLIIESLSSDDAPLQGAATAAARMIEGEGATTALASTLPNLTGPAQVMVLRMLADRGDKAALGAVIQATESADAEVKREALSALGALGDGSSVMLLASAAAGADGAERDCARASLDRLRGEDVNGVMSTGLKEGEAPVRKELIRSLAVRNAVEVVPTLLDTATDPDEGIRAESFKALQELASAEDLSKLVELLVAAGGGERQAGEKAVTAVARNATGDPKGVRVVLDALRDARDPGAKASLIRVLGELGDNDSLDALRKALKSDDGSVRDAAVRALAAWPNSAPLDAVRELAKSGESDTHKVLALRGMLAMLTMPGKRSAAETFDLYKEAIDLAPKPEERKKAIAGLGEVRDPRVPDLLKTFLADEALKEEAQKALDAFSTIGFKVFGSVNQDNAKNAIDGNPATRWDTGAPMKGGEHFIADMGWEKAVKKVVLDARGSNGDYPRGYELYVSNDPNQWGDPVATGKGDGPVTEIALDKPVKGAFIKVLQTGQSDGLYWSIHELTIETAD